MITKKLKNKIFVWNPNAFNGRGYWFVLGKNGSYGLAASKKEAGYLSRPTATQTKQNSPEPEDTESVVPEKGISENTQQFLNGLKNKFSLKNLKNMIKPTGEKMTEGMTGEKDQSEMFGKTKPSTITPEKIGNVDTAFYTKVASSRIEAPKRGDSLATVSTRILALIDKTYQEKKIERQLARNFEHEKIDEDKRRHEELIKKIYESKGVKSPKTKNKSVTKYEDKLDKNKLDDIKNIKIEEGSGGGTTGGPSAPTGTTPNKPTAPVNAGPTNASTTATKSSSTNIPPPNIPPGQLPKGVSTFNNFDQPRAHGPHKGNDYPAPVGTPLYAVKDGTITESRWQNSKVTSGDGAGYGQFIDVDHGDGTSTRYGHLSEMVVKKGDKVKAGQQIALSGNTGHSTGPHLHFEYREKDKPVKPYDYGVLAFNPGKKLEEVPKTNIETATKMSPDAEIALFRGITKQPGYANSSVGVDETAKSLMESGFKAEAKDYDKFIPPKAKDGMPLYGFSAGAAPAIDFARKNPTVKFSTAYLIDPHSSSLGPLLDNVPKNINKIIVWYNPNQTYLKPYLNRMVSHDNIEFRKNYTPHMLMPQNLKSEIVADIKNNKITQVASNDNGNNLNNKTLENKNLKNEVNPTVSVNNSQSTTKIGTKSEPRILIAKNKPDLPIFMQESIQFR
jgi:murein DD-endopeptidase MepM/ murein hydrolase activator NlpD